MKIHAIYALLSAAFFSALPTPAPQPDLPSAEGRVLSATQEDRAFDRFVGAPVSLAWESGSNEVISTGLAIEDGSHAQPELRNDPVNSVDDSGFAAFSSGAAEPMLLAQNEPAPAADATQSEWDMLGTLTNRTDNISGKLNELTSVEGLVNEAKKRFSVTKEGAAEKAAAMDAEGQTGAGDALASGYDPQAGGPQPGPAPGAGEVSNVGPVQSGAVAGATAQDVPPGSIPQVPVEQQIVSDEEGMWIRGARLNDVLQYLARVGDMQYFHNSDLDAPNYTVTGHLRDGDPVKQMEELGLMYGITIYKKGSTVYAMTSAQLSQLPTKPYQYHLRYLRPTDIEQIKAILQTMLTPGSGIIEYEPKTNTLLIIDNEQKVELVQEILGEMDQPKQQIAIETRILRINSNSSNKIGVDWTSVLGDGLTFEAEESLNALFGLPDSDTVSEVVTLTNSLVSGNTSTRSGSSDFSVVQGSTLLNGALDGDTNGTRTTNDTGLASFENTKTQGRDQNSSRSQTVAISGSNLVLSPIQLSATMKALNAGGLAQQESSPTLITEDNEEGLISIIDRVPIITSVVSETTTGQNISDEVRYRVDLDDPTITEDSSFTREIGVSISVVPTILPDNTIRMALRPRSAQITEFITGPSGNQFPRVNESSVDTIARIPNGSSLLIGGFYEEIEGSTETKVPILGDIPVLKFFFSSSEKTKNHTSLIFIVTPKLYQPESAGETMTTTRDLHQRHVLPGDHAWPDRDNPGDNFEDNLGWTVGNLVDAYEPLPPSNSLHPEHSENLFGPAETANGRTALELPHQRLEQPDPLPKPRRKGLLHHLFNRNGN